MKLIRTNAVFSRIALVSYFCAEIQLSGKIPENIPKVLFSQETHGARRGGAEDPRVRQTWPRRGPGLAAPGPCLAASDFASAPPFTYMMLMTGNLRGVKFYEKEVCSAATTRNPIPGTRSSVLALCQDGDLEEIIAIIITNASA